MSTVKQRMGPNESAMADKIYRHDKISFLCPLSGKKYELNAEENAYNYLLYSARQAVEPMIERLRNHVILKHIWTKKSLDLHRQCVVVSCKLLNLHLIYEPPG